MRRLFFLLFFLSFCFAPSTAIGAKIGPMPSNGTETTCRGATWIGAPTTQPQCNEQCQWKTDQKCGKTVKLYSGGFLTKASPPVCCCWALSGEKDADECPEETYSGTPPCTGRLSGDAGCIKERLDKAQGNTFGSKSLAEFAGGIIRAILGILGVLFLLMILIAGVKWVTSGGEEKKIGEAINMINHSLFGLIVTIAAYAITVYVLNAINSAVR